MVARNTPRKGQTSPIAASPTAGADFPIVGIGASAGGVEALELFLRHEPPACGMAFVIVQHLDPTHKGVMAELLQRATTMAVVEIRDRMKVEPDHVYVILSNRDLSMLHGVLHLLEPAAPRRARNSTPRGRWKGFCEKPRPFSNSASRK